MSRSLGLLIPLFAVGLLSLSLFIFWVLKSDQINLAVGLIDLPSAGQAMPLAAQILVVNLS